MTKGQLTLYVEREYVILAKAKGINLSKEFNDFLKERLQVSDDKTEADIEAREQALRTALASVQAEKTARELAKKQAKEEKEGKVLYEEEI